MLYQIALVLAVIAGIFAVLLFHLGLKEDPIDDRRSSYRFKKKSRWLFIWAVLFLGASSGGLEWAFYLLGYNIFTFFAFPLIAYFAIWFAFIIWIFERKKERWLWILFLLLLIAITIISFACTNCLADIRL